jgi:hypothetical protein
MCTLSPAFSRGAFFFLAEALRVARDVITLGDVAERGAEMIEIRCGRCDRAGRVSGARLLAEYGHRAQVWEVMEAQIRECQNRDSIQLRQRRDPYCPDLVRLFFRPGTG